MKDILTAPFVKEMCDTTANMYRLGWDERNGGNISYMLDEEEVAQYLDINHVLREIPTGFKADALIGRIFIVTGTGKYFKNVKTDPENNLGIIRIAEDGTTAQLLWVSDNTDGMIDKILDNIPDEAIMYLINAVSFDAEWENVYKENDISDGKFTNSEDKLMNVTMMHSIESIYLESDGCKGFIKQYKGGKYSFAALLPDNDIASFISSLSGEKLCRILSSTESCGVETKLPKFSYEYSDTLNNALSQLGMPTAFDENNADFSGIGKSTVGNISIGKVIHKTKIEVNEKGTKAGAAALVEMVDSACAINEKQVILNRPFMYMILDNETMLPLFAGIYTGV